MVWKGAWGPGNTYQPGDVVAHGGSSYIALETITPSILDANSLMQVAFDAGRLGLANGAAVASWPSTGTRAGITVACAQAVKPTMFAGFAAGEPAVRLATTAFSTGFAPTSTSEFISMGVVRLNNASSYPMLVVYPPTVLEWRCEGGSTTLGVNWLSLVSSGVALSVGQPTLVGFRYVLATQTVSIYMNGSVLVADAAISGSPAGSGQLGIGGRYENAYPWTGDIGFLGIHNSPMSEAERQLIEGTLAWRYGLQGSLPVGHPHKDEVPGAIPPDVDTDRWGLVAVEGEQGDQGIPGSPGSQGIPGSPGSDAQWDSMTQAEYDALATPDPNTLYVIVG